MPDELIAVKQDLDRVDSLVGRVLEEISDERLLAVLSNSISIQRPALEKQDAIRALLESIGQDQVGSCLRVTNVGTLLADDGNEALEPFSREVAWDTIDSNLQAWKTRQRGRIGEGQSGEGAHRGEDGCLHLE